MQWTLLSVQILLLLPYGREWGMFLLVPVYPDSPRQMAVKWFVYVCVKSSSGSIH